MSDYELIKNLQNPALYPHPVTEFKVIETHISWVILTGAYAYKIKKPVDFVFLDYSTLAKRQHFCELELQLNRPLASEIYIEVLAIHGNQTKPTFTNSGPVIEYALKMREFPQKNLFNQLQKDGKLTLKHMDQLAQILADFHASTDRDCSEYIGTAEQVHEPVIQNFDQMRPLVASDEERADLDFLQNWAQQQWQRWYNVFAERKINGFIRACHGDLHLGNIVLIDDKPVIFDCIEFNDSIRYTDVMADLAFLLMDLHDKQQIRFANHLLNRYMELTADYQGLAVLPYYLAYRAMVRAKINLMQLTYDTNTADVQLELKQTYQRFLQLAKAYSVPQKPFLVITNGLSASGKSTIARTVVEELAAVQIRSDVERKRMAGLALDAQTASGVNQNLYAPEITQQTYTHLLRLAEWIISSGFPVVIDATFLEQSQRQNFLALAQKLAVPFAILHADVSLDVIKRWLRDRGATAEAISEARLDVIEMQNDTQEPLTEEEKKFAISINDQMSAQQWLVLLQKRVSKFAPF